VHSYFLHASLLQLMEEKHSKADLLTRFGLLEQAWLTLRKTIIQDVRIFEASKHMTSSSISSPVLAALPRGQGLNADPKPSKAARAFEALVEARDESIPALLDEMEECIDAGRKNVLVEWEKAARTALDNASSRSGNSLLQLDRPGEMLNRGHSGNAVSLVDIVHIFEAKFECYSADALHLSATVDELTWSNNDDEEAGSEGNLLELQCIVLEAAPALGKPLLEELNHHLEIDKEVRRFEASESQRRR